MSFFFLDSEQISENQVALADALKSNGSIG